MSTFALICLILSITIYTLYTSILYIKYNLSCLSESYYKVGNIFTIWMLLVAFLIFPSWVEITPKYILFLPFLSSCALGAVGLNPKYLGVDRIKHILFASTTAIISLIWNLVIGIYIIPLLLVIVLIILYAFKVKNILFWTECLAFINIYLSILLS